jgi:hypothetical protein
MADRGRNERCPCGSGLKVKRCCGQRKGPSEEQLATAFLRTQGRAALDMLVTAHSRDELRELFEALADLPEHHDELVVPLPRLAHPALEPARREIAGDGFDLDSPALAEAVAHLDNPLTRAQLARAAIALRDSGRISLHLADMALADLGCSTTSLFMMASVTQALRIDAGQATRSSGLLVIR